MSKVGSYPRTVCGECQREVAYHLDAGGRAVLYRHLNRARSWCTRLIQSADPRPLIEVLGEG